MEVEKLQVRFVPGVSWKGRNIEKHWQMEALMILILKKCRDKKESTREKQQLLNVY